MDRICTVDVSYPPTFKTMLSPQTDRSYDLENPLFRGGPNTRFGHFSITSEPKNTLLNSSTIQIEIS